jgi:Skp family chaperone for outer membrane proteins
MKFNKLLVAAVLLACASGVSAQQAVDPNTSMAYDISRIAASVQTMTKTLRDFVDKFAKVEGISLAEKQQKLIVGMQLLVQAEQRAATLQRHQIELVEKEGTLRARLAQVETDLNPQMIDRSVAFEGTTQTPEIKENKRRALQSERTSLMGVLQQLQRDLTEASSSVREAQALVYRLRRTFLPQIERELADGIE